MEMEKLSTAHLLIATVISDTPPLKLTKILHVGTMTKKRKEENQDKTRIGVGSSVTVKVGEIDEKIREGKIIRKRKDMVGWM